MKRESSETRPDYYLLFVLGITFTGAGIAMGFFPLTGLGFTFMIIGGLGRAKWNRQQSA